MNKKMEAVMRGFLALSESEKSELIDEINRYQKGTRELREAIRKDVGTTVNFGPAPGGCPCCGR